MQLMQLIVVFCSGVIVGPKLGQIRLPNGTKRGLFQARFQYILLTEPKLNTLNSDLKKSQIGSI